MSLHIVGISAHYHDSACCILKDGVLIAAAEEERFSRIKADPATPNRAFRYCLEEAGITIDQINCMAYYENPEKKFERQLYSRIDDMSHALLNKINPLRIEREIREFMGYEGPVKFFDHHLAHAASSFYYSGFASSAILTVDGVGEWATTTFGKASGDHIELFSEVHFPNSIGLLYSTITSYLGFGVNDGEYKVMGLAPYGKPLYVDKMRQLIHIGDHGQYILDMQYFDFVKGNKMYSPALAILLGQPPRSPDAEITQFHKDIARSVQLVLEEVLLHLVHYLHGETKATNLCMAGGVALNCVANGVVLRKGPFSKLFVQPAANDAGGALGAAALAHVALTGVRPEKQKLKHVYLGPAYAAAEISRMLKATSVKSKEFNGRDRELFMEVARRIADGKVIGWFQGRMEFGPRSLGARSILADPRSSVMRDRINAMVKKREAFRPFAPAVLEHKASQHFDLDHPSPFMLETCQVISSLALPAITHVDGSARVQTVSHDTFPRFAALIEAFDRITGCPILLNTSFNVKGQPIVCTPEDALQCFIMTQIDCLVLENFVIDRADNTFDVVQTLLHSANLVSEEKESLHEVYTFI